MRAKLYRQRMTPRERAPELPFSLEINAEDTTKKITSFLREQVAEHQRDGIVLGLSGGLDSTVVAILSTRALGGPQVHGLYLYDRDSEHTCRRRAEALAERLHMPLEARDIGPSLGTQGVYSSLVLRRSFRLVNRSIVYLSRPIYHLLFRETNYVLTLRHGKPAKSWLQRLVHSGIADAIEKGFNVRHRERRRIVEDYADEHNLLPVGAANRSESLVGWFVKDGIDDLRIEPLLGLYKTQVRQLAASLGAEESIVSSTPSPDMFKGVSDEMILGFPYEKIDQVLYALEHDVDEAILLRNGIRCKEIEGIRKLHRLSAWKRANPHVSPDLDAAE